MKPSQMRRRIAVEAARLMYERLESEYFTAKRKAAARLGVNPRHQPQELPSNREIRDELQVFARVHEGEARTTNLQEMRVAALHMMRKLERFHPRLIGSVMTGHIREGSDIDLHVFSASVANVVHTLEQQGHTCEVERKRVLKHNEERIFTHVHLHDRFTFELTVYGLDQLSYVFKSSITGQAIERASLDELEAMIAREYPDVDLAAEGDEPEIEPGVLWPVLLVPLADVKQDPQWHPEGDALYHSLQAFEVARATCPYDEELIAAALLHDVGKAIDPHDHVAAGLEALEGTLTPREAFLIAHHMDAQALKAGTLGVRAARRLRESEWFEDLMLLRDIDDQARRPGAAVCSVEEAIAYIESLEGDLAF
ncbi:MAG: HD domain-containing protein [Phycisphaerae bacterium]|jgi:predicted nucleotidyltransferase/predicted HD phosphohydrolase